MPSVCQAKNCRNMRGSSKSFFRFPDPSKSEACKRQCSLWIDCLGNKKLNLQLFTDDKDMFKRKYVCEEHFNGSDILSSEVAISMRFGVGRKTLRKGAIPLRVNFSQQVEGAVGTQSKKFYQHSKKGQVAKLKEKYSNLKRKKAMSTSLSTETGALDGNDQPTSCRNPWHDKWGSKDVDFKWPSQVPTRIQYIFRLLGYERAPGTRCKFCVQCVDKAGNLQEEEIRELERQASLKMSRRQSENIHIQQQLEKLDKLNISAEEKALQAKQLRMLAFVNPGKFMEDFDPERSTREMKKMNRRIYKEKNSKRNQIYNENGLLLSNNADLCDCLEQSCPGCHFPCPKCDSEKCGADCRNNRRWIYDHIDIEGTGKTVTWTGS